ncbi:hypothetical protein PIB30_101494, partial [Stylosanthes scabra]|nr:hypothetical protein [Stylosanthes scabra]
RKSGHHGKSLRRSKARSNTCGKDIGNPTETQSTSPSFKDDENVSGELDEIRQIVHGSPFTYHTHPNSLHMSSDMPRCLDLVFRPPEGMSFVGSKFAVAAYIFGRGRYMREVLVSNEHSLGERHVLWNLCPREALQDDQIALSPVNHNIDTFEFIRTRFMGFADDLMRIYVPLHKDNHWYLMIIDFMDRKLIYLDSAKDKSQRIFYREYASGQEVLAKTRSPQASPITKRLLSFCLLVDDAELDVVRLQHWGKEINDQTRFRLALDLVMDRFNPVANEISRRAMDDWDVKMQLAARGQNGIEAGTNEASPSASPTI